MERVGQTQLTHAVHRENGTEKRGLCVGGLSETNVTKNLSNSKESTCHGHIDNVTEFSNILQGSDSKHFKEQICGKDLEDCIWAKQIADGDINE